MVIETQLQPFLQWLPGGLWSFAQAFLAIFLLALVVGYLVAAVRYGPMRAGDTAYRVLGNGLMELIATSPRRVWALTRLAIQESMRRRVWVALVVFGVILAFANWFLENESPHPARLYLSFVLTATTYLVLLLALFLSAFSLPTDMKNRTIYTVVTKPVRCSEIVLGRILGFTLIGTALLVLMGLGSYAFIWRGLSHTHEAVALDPIEGDTGPVGLKGRSTRDLYHRHDLTLDMEGKGASEPMHAHWHSFTPLERDGETVYVSGPVRDMFQARVPVYGKLRFKDRTGNEVARGISVGSEWGYRSYIEGGSLASAIWTFEGVDAETFPDGLPIEMSIRVFRTYKGVIDRGILGSLVLRNPESGLTSAIETFRAKDFYIDEHFIPRALTDSDGNEIDLFEDLVTKEGKLEIVIQCLEKSQYYGIAQADLYLRARDGSFGWNFVKGYAGIWVQMVMVVCLGVMFSTFLSGPVAMLATLGALVLGFFSDFLVRVVEGIRGLEGGVEGGGPAEALIRMVTQTNVTTELDDSIGKTVAQTIDHVLAFFMNGVAAVLPDFRSYSNVDYVAYGFNIPAGLMGQHLMVCLAYVLGAVIAGYFFLRLREVAK